MGKVVETVNNNNNNMINGILTNVIGYLYWIVEITYKSVNRFRAIKILLKVLLVLGKLNVYKLGKVISIGCSGQAGRSNAT